MIGPDVGEIPKDGSSGRRIADTARRLGELIAKEGWVLLTGGCRGVMEYASEGASKAGGIVVGTPGRTRGVSNLYVDVEIVTEVDIGSFIFAGILSCDALVVIPGGAGTLAELCIAYRAKRPCVIMRGFSDYYDGFIDNYMDGGRSIKLYGADTPEKAMEVVEGLIGWRSREQTPG